LAESALCRLAARGKSLDQNIVKRSAFRDSLLELVRSRAQRLVGERLQLFLERVDLRHARQITLDPTLVRGTKQLAGDGTDHATSPSRFAQCRSSRAGKSNGTEHHGKNRPPPRRRMRVFIGNPRNAENAALFERISCKRRQLAAEAAGFVET